MAEQQNQNQFNLVHLLKRGESVTLCGLPRNGALSGGSKNIQNVTCKDCARLNLEGQESEVDDQIEVQAEDQDQAKVQIEDQIVRDRLNLAVSDLKAAIDVLSLTVATFDSLLAKLIIK